MVDGVVVHMHGPGLPFANALSTVLSSLPAADRTSLSELSITGMRAWSTAKADEYHRYILALRAIQNILAPVHRLPPEILSRIFVQAWKHRKSLRLTHVCRLWRSLLLDTSQFWAVAVARDEFRLPSDDKEVSDEDYLAAACLRSAPRNISLRLSSISPRGHLQLIQHADRITSMKISVRTRDQVQWLWKVLHTGMHRLEDLAIHACAPTKGGTGSGKLSIEELPRLTRLTLPARLFRHSWPNTLREIALRSDLGLIHGNGEFGSPRSMVSLALVLQLLQDYPRLRVLDIRDNALFHATQSRPPSRAFPTLALLQIRSHWDVVSAMLSLLTFPSSTRVDIEIVSRPRLVQSDLFVPGAALDGVVSLIDQVAIQSGPMSTIQGYTNGVERVRVCASFPSSHPSQVERTLRLFIRTNAPVSHLLLAQRPSQSMPITFKAWIILPAFPHLTHFILHSRSDVCIEFLETLNPSASPFSMLLPLLKDLTVGFATKRRSAISSALRCDDIPPDGVVAVHFRECCMIFQGVLVARSRRGYRLSRLKFFSYEEGCINKGDPVVSTIDLAALKRELVESGIRPLQVLVDGPVVFSGYRFFTHGSHYETTAVDDFWLP